MPSFSGQKRAEAFTRRPQKLKHNELNQGICVSCTPNHDFYVSFYLHVFAKSYLGSFTFLVSVIMIPSTAFALVFHYQRRKLVSSFEKRTQQIQKADMSQIQCCVYFFSLQASSSLTPTTWNMRSRAIQLFRSNNFEVGTIVDSSLPQPRMK